MYVCMSRVVQLLRVSRSQVAYTSMATCREVLSTLEGIRPAEPPQQDPQATTVLQAEASAFHAEERSGPGHVCAASPPPEPPAHHVSIPPAHQVGIPPAHQVGIPPAHQVGIPPAHQVGIPPAHQVGIPPAYQAGIPPAHQANKSSSVVNVCCHGEQVAVHKDQDGSHGEQAGNLGDYQDGSHGEQAGRDLAAVAGIAKHNPTSLYVKQPTGPQYPPTAPQYPPTAPQYHKTAASQHRGSSSECADHTPSESSQLKQGGDKRPWEGTGAEEVGVKRSYGKHKGKEGMEQGGGRMERGGGRMERGRGGMERGGGRMERGRGSMERGGGSRQVAPNAFVSIRVRSPAIREKMREVQAAMELRAPTVAPSFVSLDKLHITMMVVHLNSKEQIEKAVAVLGEAAAEVSQTLRVLDDPLELHFKGVGSFGDSVVYAALKMDEAAERLSLMEDIIVSVFAKHGLQSAGVCRSFSPHLTIAKTRQHGRHGRLKPEIYAELLDTEFGSEPVTGLELLSMTLPVDKDGYYHCFQSCAFDKLL